MNYLSDPVLIRWIEPRYLSPDVLFDLRQSALAKPGPQYVVMDGFFRPEQFTKLVIAHDSLQFSEEADRRAPDGSWLPYDGEVAFATPDSVGGELFFSEAWHLYCAELVTAALRVPAGTTVKLRRHREHADGFWIHTDGGLRQIVAICYYNQGWAAADGGLLQLWRPEAPRGVEAKVVNSPVGRMDFLARHDRIRTVTPGGGLPAGLFAADFLLVDQIVPTANRLFLCNFQSDPAYHSITPSNGRIRTDFVQWIGV